MLVPQSCPTLCNSVGCSPPGFSVYGILQARILEWVAISFAKGSSWPRDHPGLLLCRCILYCLSHQGSPFTLTAEEGGRRRWKKKKSWYQYLWRTIRKKSTMVRSYSREKTMREVWSFLNLRCLWTKVMTSHSFVITYIFCHDWFHDFFCMFS